MQKRAEEEGVVGGLASRDDACRWPWFDSRSRPDLPFSVEKVALFCNPASEDKFSSTAIEIIKWVKFFAVFCCGDLRLD
jgi:hypothetical protein